MQAKRIISLVLGTAMLLSLISSAAAFDARGNQAAATGDRINVIVQFAGASDYAALEKAIGPVTYVAKWDAALNGFAATMTTAQMQALSRTGLVSKVEPERIYTVDMDTATLYTGVQQARQDYGVTGDRDGKPGTYSNQDVVVAVIDTGIDASHVDLDGGKVIGWKDMVNGKATPYDDHGHGSHVSGIIAGEGQGNPAYKGVAPGAALVGIKVLNGQGAGTSTQVINGINWMINNKETYHIKVGNMSLGGSGCSDGTDAISAAVNNAVAKGIVMAVAAGNSGPGKCTVGSPGAAANAITVGAAYDIGEQGWALAEFSSRGPTLDGRIKPDIITPGRYINSVAKGTGNGYTVMSGTSMATPFLAGTVALLFGCNYNLTDAEVKSALYAPDSVQDRGAVGKDVDWGNGLSLSYNAVRRTCKGTKTYDDGQDWKAVTESLPGAGAAKSYTLNVTSTARPIAIDLIMTNWTYFLNPDFDLYLYSPAGQLVASSEGSTRQELIRFTPQATGTYTVKVRSYLGSGAFNLDMSWK